MIKKYNKMSFAWGVPGVAVQTYGIVLFLHTPAADAVAWGIRILGTLMLAVGLMYYAASRGRSIWWGLTAPLSLISLAFLLTLEDRTSHTRPFDMLLNRTNNPGSGPPIRRDSELAAEFWETGRCESCPLYDMHGHMGPWRAIYFPRAEPEQMLRTMDAAGVKLICFAHHAAMLAPDIGDQPGEDAVRAHPDRFRAYMFITPHYPDILDRKLASFDDNRDVFAGFKFLPSYLGVPITDDKYKRAWEFANERSLPVLCHTWGGSTCDGPDQIRAIAGKYPDIKLILGHSFCPDWDSAVAVAAEHPNTWLELTAVFGKRGALELFTEKIGSERILFGTDLPWFSTHHGIGSLLSADITDDDRHNICHRNARKILQI